MSRHDSKEEIIGTVQEALPNREFRVLVRDDQKDRAGKVVRAYLAGKLNKGFIKVLIGDTVKLYCPPQGDICRITFRPTKEYSRTW